MRDLPTELMSQLSRARPSRTLLLACFAALAGLDRLRDHRLVGEMLRFLDLTCIEEPAYLGPQRAFASGHVGAVIVSAVSVFAAS